MIFDKFHYVEKSIVLITCKANRTFVVKIFGHLKDKQFNLWDI